MSKPRFAWSYSAVSAFNTCPRKFYNERVLKRYPFVSTAAAEYGKRLHGAIELYGRDATPLPQEFQFTKPIVDIVRDCVRGEKFWERKVAFKEDFTECTYFDKETWLRAQLDFLSVDMDSGVARVIDWKSGGSKYADTTQLELMALVTFKLYPQIEQVKAGLSFVVEGRFVPATYYAQKQEAYWMRWNEDLERMDAAYVSGVWNPKPNGLCRKHCPVTDCEFNGGYTGAIQKQG